MGGVEVNVVNRDSSFMAFGCEGRVKGSSWSRAWGQRKRLLNWGAFGYA